MAGMENIENVPEIAPPKDQATNCSNNQYCSCRWLAQKQLEAEGGQGREEACVV